MTTSQEISSEKKNIDALTNEFFQAVSFKEGEKPAYGNLYRIFIASGQFIKNSSTPPEIATISQFIEPRQRLVDAGELTSFKEEETGEITEMFGNIAHRWSTYDKFGISKGSAFEGRGIISIQFILTEDGWKISAMAWDDERPGLSIPDRYK